MDSLIQFGALPTNQRVCIRAVLVTPMHRRCIMNAASQSERGHRQQNPRHVLRLGCGTANRAWSKMRLLRLSRFQKMCIKALCLRMMSTMLTVFVFLCCDQAGHVHQELYLLLSCTAAIQDKVQAAQPQMSLPNDCSLSDLSS